MNDTLGLRRSGSNCSSSFQEACQGQFRSVFHCLMNSATSRPDVVEGEEWQIVATDWWHTPFSSVSWTYSLPNNTASKPNFAKPPHYHGSLFQTGPGASSTRFSLDASRGPGIAGEDDLLNADLVGVRGAGEVISPYEADVGFYHSRPLEWETADTDIHEKRLPAVSDDDIALGKERWDELVDNLTGGFAINQAVFDDFAEDSDELNDGFTWVGSNLSSGVSRVHLAASAYSDLGLAKSRHSVDVDWTQPMLSAKRSYANVLVEAVSPQGSISGDEYPLGPSASRPLNAAASAFVPSFSIPAKVDSIRFPSLARSPISDTGSSSSTFSSFSFPSPDVPPFPDVKIKKDEQGFYTEVEPVFPLPSSRSQPMQRLSTALLPPFLQDPLHRRKAPASKTRAIVDRLRSSHQPQSLGLGVSNGLGIQSLSASPSPPYNGNDFFQPRLSISEDGRGRDSSRSSPSIEADEEGWIGVEEVTTAQKAKAQRTRELFLALTRHRSDSVHSDSSKGWIGVDEGAGSGEGDNDHASSIFASPSSSPPPISPLRDGWVEGLILSQPPTQAKPQRAYPQSEPLPSRPVRKEQPPTVPATVSLPTPHVLVSTPLPTKISQYPFTAPASYFYTAHPSTYATYMQMQMQFQLQLQMRRAGGVPRAAAPATFVPPGYPYTASYSVSGAPTNVPPLSAARGPPSAPPISPHLNTSLNFAPPAASAMRLASIW